MTVKTLSAKFEHRTATNSAKIGHRVAIMHVIEYLIFILIFALENLCEIDSI